MKKEGSYQDKSYRIGIIGLGNESSFGFQLARSIWDYIAVDRLLINSRRMDKVVAFCDNQLDGRPANYAPVERLADETDLTIICLENSHGASKQNLDNKVSRRNLYEGNVDPVREIAQTYSRVGYDGRVIIVSNPTDMLTKTFLEEFKGDECQVMGFNHADTSRLERILRKRLQRYEEKPIDRVFAEVWGEHGPNSMAIPSKIRIYVDGVEKRIIEYEHETEKMRGIKQEVDLLPFHLIRFFRSSNSDAVPALGEVLRGIDQGSGRFVMSVPYEDVCLGQPIKIDGEEIRVLHEEVKRLPRKRLIYDGSDLSEHERWERIVTKARENYVTDISIPNDPYNTESVESDPVPFLTLVGKDYENRQGYSFDMSDDEGGSDLEAVGGTADSAFSVHARKSAGWFKRHIVFSIAALGISLFSAGFAVGRKGLAERTGYREIGYSNFERHELLSEKFSRPMKTFLAKSDSHGSYGPEGVDIFEPFEYLNSALSFLDKEARRLEDLYNRSRISARRKRKAGDRRISVHRRRLARRSLRRYRPHRRHASSGRHRTNAVHSVSLIPEEAYAGIRPQQPSQPTIVSLIPEEAYRAATGKSDQYPQMTDSLEYRTGAGETAEKDGGYTDGGCTRELDRRVLTGSRVRVKTRTVVISLNSRRKSVSRKNRRSGKIRHKTGFY